jgi:hypothetical protein
MKTIANIITGSVIKMSGAGMAINNYPLCTVKASAEPDIRTTAGNLILFSLYTSCSHTLVQVHFYFFEFLKDNVY